MHNAFEVLGITDRTNVSWKDIKYGYRINALKYHPDKNKTEDAAKRFLEIQEAYEYLEKRWKDGFEMDSEPPVISNSYKDMLDGVLNILAKNNNINDMLKNILGICENKSLEILETIDHRKFNMIYVILKKYRNIFALSESFYVEMEKIKNGEKKEDGLEIFTLNPTINDLWDNLVYKWTMDDEIYLVPLWHRELIYEHKQKEFMIECKLKDTDIWIDDENNIHKQVHYCIDDIFGQEKMEVFYGKKGFTFSPEIIQLKKEQTIVWHQEGISKIMPDIQNITKKSDVFLHIFLERE